MIINLGPIGEKFDALKHILIKPSGSTSYVKFKDSPSTICSLADNQDNDAWYIKIVNNCTLKLDKKWDKIINIACVGGGGGGAGSTFYSGISITGGGGNGGKTTTTTAILVKDTEYSLTIGQGGVGGQWKYTASGAITAITASSGGNTKFSTILTATGGASGYSEKTTQTNTNITTNNYNSSTCGGKGGYGLVGNKHSGTGDDFKPQDGEAGTKVSWWPNTATYFGAGGGGGAPYNTETTSYAGGKGGTSGAGKGGTGFSSWTTANCVSACGSKATIYGSGGGGAGWCNGTGDNTYPSGGSGNSGVILLRIPKK